STLGPRTSARASSSAPGTSCSAPRSEGGSRSRPSRTSTCSASATERPASGGEGLEAIAQLLLGAGLELPRPLARHPEAAADRGEGELFLRVGHHPGLHDVPLARVEVLHGLGEPLAEEGPLLGARKLLFLVVVVRGERVDQRTGAVLEHLGVERDVARL